MHTIQYCNIQRLVRSGAHTSDIRTGSVGSTRWTWLVGWLGGGVSRGVVPAEKFTRTEVRNLVSQSTQHYIIDIRKLHNSSGYVHAFCANTEHTTNLFLVRMVLQECWPAPVLESLPQTHGTAPHQLPPLVQQRNFHEVGRQRAESKSHYQFPVLEPAGCTWTGSKRWNDLVNNCDWVAIT